jgi:ABC-type sulfate transport system permease component
MTGAPRTLETRLSLLLGRGTWLACAVIGAGLAVRLLRHDAMGDHIISTGVGLIIALPVIRVAAMLEHFHRSRQRKLALTCALVLAIVAAGTVLGLATRG